MDFSRKLIVLLIIIIFIYIIFRLIIKRIQIKQAYHIKYNTEGYENQTTESIQNDYKCSLTIQNNLKQKLENIRKYAKNAESLYLRNFAIKSSLNTAYNGKENSTDMINYVMTRGCRFLDFEVYLYKDPVTEVTSSVVSISKNGDADFLPLDSNLTISDVLFYVNMYAFNATCPNYEDPIFIQLRPKIIKNNDYDNNKKILCSAINQAIVANLSPLYSGKINSTTSLYDLLGKIIIVMDDSEFSDCSLNVNLSSNSTPVVPTTPTTPTNTCPPVDSSNNVNPYVNVPIMQTYSYQTLPLQQNALTLNTSTMLCNVTTITQVLFEDVNGVSYTTNVDSYYLFKNYSCQIIPMMFWNTGGDLCNYETLFNICGGGIVPLTLIYRELNKKQEKYIDYPGPMFAFSIYGSRTTTLFILVTCLAMVGFIVVREMT